MLVGEVVHVRIRDVWEPPVPSVPFLAVNPKKKKKSLKINSIQKRHFIFFPKCLLNKGYL